MTEQGRKAVGRSRGGTSDAAGAGKKLIRKKTRQTKAARASGLPADEVTALPTARNAGWAGVPEAEEEGWEEGGADAWARCSALAARIHRG